MVTFHDDVPVAASLSPSCLFSFLRACRQVGKQTGFQLQGQDEHVAPVTLPLLLGFPSKAHPGVKVTALTWPLQKVTEQAGTAAERSLLTAASSTLTLRAELIRKPSWSQQAEALGPNEASEEGRRPGVFASHLHRVSESLGACVACMKPKVPSQP